MVRKEEEGEEEEEEGEVLNLQLLPVKRRLQGIQADSEEAVWVTSWD